MEAPKRDSCVKHSSSCPSIVRAVSFAALGGEDGLPPTQLLRSSSDTCYEVKPAEKAGSPGFTTRVNKCRNCGYGFFASYSRGGSDFCSLDCRTSCEWLKLIKEQKQSARQVTSQLVHIPAPFAEPVPAFASTAVDDPSQPIQMNAVETTAAIPIAME